MSHHWANPDNIAVLVMRQLSSRDPEVVTAVVQVPAGLVQSQLDYPHQVVDAVKEKFCEKFPEFKTARWWPETAPFAMKEYDGPLIGIN